MAKQWVKLLGAFASGALLMHMAKQAHENNITVHSWSSRTISGQSHKLKIFFITDIHRRRISEEMLLGLKEECDVVLIGGDLTEKWVPKKRTEKNIEKLTEIAPTFFVRGNNDEEVDQAWLTEMLMSYGVVYLDDDFAKVKIKGIPVRIVGLSNKLYGESDIEQLLGKEGNEYTICLCHFPETSTFMHGLPIDVMLSGHTHGGQIRLFGYGIDAPGRLTREGGFMKLVSRGYGTTTLPLRLGAAPESHLITITPSEAKVDE